MWKFENHHYVKIEKPHLKFKYVRTYDQFFIGVVEVDFIFCLLILT